MKLEKVRKILSLGILMLVIASFQAQSKELSEKEILLLFLKSKVIEQQQIKEKCEVLFSKEKLEKYRECLKLEAEKQGLSDKGY
jgi:hypothetical protein